MAERRSFATRVLAGLRAATIGRLHPVVRAVARTRGLPLADALPLLRDLTRGCRPPRARAAAFAEETLGLSGPALARWCRAFGVVVGRGERAIVDRLADGREAELAERIDPPDVGPIERLRADGSRGVLLVGVHLGPPFAVRSALAPRLPRLRSFVSGVNDVLSVGEQIALADATARRRSLLDGTLHLRAGGEVCVAADGRYGELTLEGRSLGRRVLFSSGPVALARASCAPALPVVARWSAGDRIRVEYGDPLPAAPPREARLDADAIAAWDAAWLDAFTRWHDAIVRDAPDDVRMRGGLFRRTDRGLFA